MLHLTMMTAMDWTVAKHVNQDCKISRNKNIYNCRVDFYSAHEYASQTMMDLLKILILQTPQLPMIMICNMITNLINKHPTPLQVAIGVAIKEKELIQELYSFGVVCSYDEVLRFRKSAAMASKAVSTRGLVHASEKGAGLVQVIVDNFDASISSQNGLQSVHALAMLMTQTDTTVHGDASSSQTIRHIKKEEMTVQIDDDPQIYRYRGPQKPEMPSNKSKKAILPLKILATQMVASNRAFIRDFLFLSRMANTPTCPEWNGFNYQLNREEGHTVRPASTCRCVYTPLIDMKPRDNIYNIYMHAVIQCYRTWLLWRY